MLKEVDTSEMTPIIVEMRSSAFIDLTESAEKENVAKLKPTKPQQLHGNR